MKNKPPDLNDKINNRSPKNNSIRLSNTKHVKSYCIHKKHACVLKCVGSIQCIRNHKLMSINNFFAAFINL